MVAGLIAGLLLRSRLVSGFGNFCFFFFFCPGQFSLVWIDEEFQLFPPLEGQSCLLLEDRKSSYPSGAAGLYLSDGDQLFLSALTSRHDCTVGGHSDREKQCQGWPCLWGPAGTSMAP